MIRHPASPSAAPRRAAHHAAAAAAAAAGMRVVARMRASETQPPETSTVEAGHVQPPRPSETPSECTSEPAGEGG